MKDVLLRKAAEKDFYNTSKYTFERLMDDPDHIEEDFRDYLNGFSANVQDILEKFKFDGHITTMANKGILYIVLKEHTTDRGNLHPNEISNLEMGYIFEEIIRRLGNKRNDISEEDIAEITKIYGDFKESEISQIYDNEDFGYTKITVERPLRDEEGNLVLKKGKKQPDTSLRDTENVPLKEDIKEYFEREVLPFAPDAWIDTKKSKVGYEIPFTRYFYKYEAPRPSAEIMAEIMDLETELSGSLEEVFDL